MKTFTQLITELRQQVNELLDIYRNPNAFTPKDSGIETKREREFRLAWERRAKARGGAGVYDKELKRLEKLRKTSGPNRQPFPWKRYIAGWWHPTNSWLTFNESQGHHVVQVVKDPQRFGITESEMNQAFEEHIKKERLTKLDPVSQKVWEDDTGLKPGEKIQPKHIKRMIIKKQIDLCAPLETRVYEKGWLKVYGGSTYPCTLEGSSVPSMKAAIGEIAGVAGESIEVDITHRTPGSKTKDYRISGIAAAERFLAK